MKTLIQSITGKKRHSATVVDGKLILSFPDAITPVVWQMDLGKTKASALEVQSKQKDTAFSLTLKTPKGENLNIATFEDRLDAVAALIVTAKAFESSAGHIHAPHTSDPANQNKALIPYDGAAHGGYYAKPRKPFPWLPVLGSLAVIVLLLFIWGNLQPTRIGASQPAAFSGSSPQTPQAPKPSEAGVPLSADDFLMNR
jgi:hypothetical protein